MAENKRPTVGTFIGDKNIDTPLNTEFKNITKYLKQNKDKKLSDLEISEHKVSYTENNTERDIIVALFKYGFIYPGMHSFTSPYKKAMGVVLYKVVWFDSIDLIECDGDKITLINNKYKDNIVKKYVFTVSNVDDANSSFNTFKAMLYSKLDNYKVNIKQDSKLDIYCLRSKLGGNIKKCKTKRAKKSKRRTRRS